MIWKGQARWVSGSDVRRQIQSINKLFEVGFAPTRSFTIDVVDFHPSVDRVKALGGAVAFAAWICFGGPRVVIDSDETESGRGNVYPGSQADD